MDESARKEALRLFTYGLYAVTCGDDSKRNAFTANWISQVSFDPPLVVVSVENDSVSLPIIRTTARFAVNVFGAEQRDLAGRLGKSYSKHPDKLEGLQWDVGQTGCPVLLDTLAYAECEVESETPAGDSTLVLGRVVGAHVLRKDEPLTMLAAGFKHAG
ncbi:MAG TPA: flavin reductase family protein [Ktedonobacterales bacterium]|jgi:flavin reductase (DIM6/NTAB) family NADH-FMN oxidoreductase RutF|nr:flavin reductase family protein [Ktedonobacterales bacterium]